MPTTIQINKDTLELLKRYKEQTKAGTYDETIKKIMVLKLDKYARKFRGYLGKRNMAFVMKDLRDKTSRY